MAEAALQHKRCCSAQKPLIAEKQARNAAFWPYSHRMCGNVQGVGRGSSCRIKASLTLSLDPALTQTWLLKSQ
ncbi:MAG: hypothetical protein KDJ74_15135, partial [Notoacmeibacter sp.]|nr:hypothetical protein [Notoacmeibacter sp.]